MLSVAKRLIKYGFVKSDYKNICKKYIGANDSVLEGLPEKDAEEYADQELAEFTKDHWGKTPYPKPAGRFFFAYQNINFGVEYIYYWILHRMRQNEDFSYFDKVTDTYAAASSSSHFGMMQARLSAQQNQASQYLKGISDMVKGLFQIVRELRILDERIQYYEDTYDKDSPNRVSSEIVLKGLWIDLVEGGPKNPASVYGMAREVGFTILPDIFFRIQVEDPKDIDRVVNASDFNEKIKEVLKRKLRQYYEWKKRTYSELKTRRKFEIKYLRQHYDTIKLYISWIKPYLKNIAMLQPKDSWNETARLINSFEGAIAEIEVIARKKEAGKEYWAVILANFLYSVRPQLDYHLQEYQHKGPVHVGRVELTLRSYAWNDEQLENYKKYKEEETMYILGSIDASIREALDSLGDELKNYLIQGGETFEEKKKKEKSKLEKNMQTLSKSAEPFTAVFKGFGEMFSAFGLTKDIFKVKKGGRDPYVVKKDKGAAKKDAIAGAFMAYHYYKKSHGLTAW